MLNKEEVAARKLFSERMLAARELNRFTQTNAAAVLGIAQGDLALIERFQSGEPISLSLIKKAAKAYAVSSDYLLGLCDYYSTEPNDAPFRYFMSHLQNQLIETQGQATAQLFSQQNEINTLIDTIKALAPQINAISKSLGRVRELFPEFDDLRASANLLYAVENAQKAADLATIGLVRENTATIVNVP